MVGPGLHAVIVPDMVALRQRRIVNVRELIRFELEGLSLSLPSHQRVVSFEIEFGPRTSAEPSDDHARRVVAAVQALAGSHVTVRADSTFELDLGLDSIERVELLATLEQRFGRRLPDAVAQTALAVHDVVDALRGGTETREHADCVWATLLDVQQPSPILQGLLHRRTITVSALFVAFRVAVRLLAKPRVAGLEHLPREGPFIITPNHQSYIDPLVLNGVLPFRVFRRLFFVGAAEFFETRASAWLARVINIVPVDPDSKLLPAMQAGAFGLRHGKVLMLFPEGERSIDGGVKKFRKGAAILSQRLHVPVVPVAIDGTFDIWPRGRPLDWRRLLPWSSHSVRVRFGAPIAPPRAASYADHIRTIRASVARLRSETSEEAV